MASLQQQLDQVNAALVGMPDNEMLLKLKADIEETFKLAQEVASGPGSGASAPSTGGADTPAAHDGGSTAGAAASAAAGSAARTWRAGDTVQAKYSADGMMYAATVMAVSGTDSYTVTFSAGGTEVVHAEDVLPPKSTGSD